MMRLVHCGYGIDAEIRENIFNVLVVESHAVFSKIIGELLYQSEGHEGGFVISKSGKPMNPAKSMELILSPFCISYKDRKILNRLYQELEEISNEKYFEKAAKIESLTIDYIDSLTQELPYPIKFETVCGTSEILKLHDVAIEDTSENIGERLCDYIKIMRRLCDIELMVIVNLGQYLSAEELNFLYETASYEKMAVFSIESTEREWADNERVDIIDKDLCLINVR